MLKVKRKFARAGAPKWEVLRDVDKLHKTVLICPLDSKVDKSQIRGDITVIRWCTARHGLEPDPRSILLLVPVRGGGLGAATCVAQYLPTRKEAIERIILCTDIDKMWTLSAAAGNMLIRSRTPRTDQLACKGYRDELLELFGADRRAVDNESATLNMNLDYAAFAHAFGHFMKSEVYPALSDRGSLDLNWLVFSRDGISSSDALVLHEKGEGGCPGCIETIEKVPGTLEFCLTSMISILFQKIGHETHFDQVPNAQLTPTLIRSAYGGRVDLRDFYKTAGIGQVKGDVSLLGNVVPDGSQRKTMVVGLRTAGMYKGYTAIVVTEQCIRDQGNLRRLKNLHGYLHLLCTCIRLQKELEAQGVRTTVVRVGHTRNVLCSSFESGTIGGRLYGSNSRTAKLRRNVPVEQEQSKWSGVLDKRTIELLSIDVDFANWVFFTVVVQIEHSYPYVIVKRTGVDESYTAVDRCLDIDLVQYKNGNFLISLQGAARLLEFFRNYGTRQVPTLAWEFMVEVAELECVLNISSSV